MGLPNDAPTHRANGRMGEIGMAGLIWPVALTLVLFAAMLHPTALTDVFGWDANGLEAHWTGRVLHTFFWLATAFAGQRWVRVIVWHGIVEARSGVEPPGLLIDLTALAFYLTALIIILNFVYGLPVTGILTTSSIAIAVIGFALRTMISDLFTGLALGVERPFQIGDWLELPDGTVGRVQSMNWRATRLLTTDDIAVVIPNSQLAHEQFKNFSSPDRHFRDEIELILDYSVTGWRAERLILSAVWSVPEVIALPKKPEVRIRAFEEHGVVWRIRYWVPDYRDLHRLRYEVQRAILRNMHFSGVQVPGKKIEHRPLPEDRPMRDLDFLNEVDLFRLLTEEELKALEDGMTRCLFKRGKPVVREGDAGSSLFIVKEGMLTALVQGADGRDTPVNHLTPGTFFGEMSLMTGAPRTATVIPDVDSIGFEITREILTPIIQARPDLAARLSDALATRQIQTRETFAAMDTDTAKTRTASLAKDLLIRITAAFNL